MIVLAAPTIERLFNGAPLGPYLPLIALFTALSMPAELIRIHEDPFRPQPRLDRDAGHGMTTSVGRIRKEPLFRHGVKYVLVSHNTKMGAAKGSILVAEYLVKKGMV